MGLDFQNPNKMKNFNLIIKFCLLFFYTSNLSAQTTDRFIDITKDRGIVFCENMSDSTLNTAIIDFRNTGMNMPDSSYLILRATADSSLNNNVIITARGAIHIGTIDPDEEYSILEEPTDTPDIKFHIHDGKALGSEWLVYSDQRLKKNINDYTKSLETLNQVNLYEYEYNGLAGTQDGQKRAGIMAQEIKELLPNAVTTFRSKLSKEDTKAETLFAFNPDELLYLAVNSIKELADKQEELEQANEVLQSLQEQHQELEAELQTIKEYLGLSQTESEIEKAQKENTPNSSILHSSNVLYQCIPNPSEGMTRIPYELSPHFQTAQVIIYDMDGRTIKTFALSQSGKNEIVWQPQSAMSGIYTYTLVVNNKVIDSKKLILK